VLLFSIPNLFPYYQCVEDHFEDFEGARDERESHVGGPEMSAFFIWSAVGKDILLMSSNTMSDDDGRLADTWPIHPLLLWRSSRT